MKRALVIAHEPDGVAGMVGDRLEQRGYELTTHVVTTDYDNPSDFAPFPDFAEFDVIVPMGSVRSVYDTDTIGDWIGIELELLRDAHQRNQPILGVCFGGQALAAALGGSVEKSPDPEIGWYEFVSDGPLPDGPWFEWHDDRIVLPPDAIELARSGNTPQMFRHGSAVGTQFHPEVSHAHLAGFLEGGGDAELAARGIDADALLSETAANEAAARQRCNDLVDWFLAEVADASPTSTENE